MVELAGLHGAVNLFALPCGKVGIGQRQGRQFGGGRRVHRSIGLFQVIQQKAAGPQVANGMVDHPQQHVVRLVQPDQHGPVQAGHRKVKREGGEITQYAAGFTHLNVARHIAQVHDNQLLGLMSGDHLHGFAVDQFKAGAERFVALRDLIERTGQPGRVQPATQAQRKGDVVGGCLRGDLLHEPHAALRIRAGQRAASRHPVDGRRAAQGTGGSVVLGGREPRGQRIETCLLEYRAQRQFYVQSGLDA